MQRLLNKHGWDVGEPDGKVGNGTRGAVKKAQLKFGLPADSYPDMALLQRLEGGAASNAREIEKPEAKPEAKSEARPVKRAPQHRTQR